MSDQTVIRHDIGQHGVLELRTVSGSIRLAGHGRHAKPS